MKLAALLALGVSGAVAAAQIETLKVDHAGDRYWVSMRVLLDAPAAAAYRAFADPRNLRAINPAVEDMSVQADGGLYTQVRICAGVFCKVMRQVQSMRYTPRSDGGHISATVDPARSDLSFGAAQWDFAAQGARTRLEFAAALEPKFWIPPFLGPWLVESSLRQQAQRTCAGIESLARQHGQ